LTQRADIAVIGGGPGGYPAAIRATQRGAKVVLFEHDRLGGVCLNRGCIPSKALIESARVFSAVRDGERHGLKTGAPPTVDWARALSRKASVVARMIQGVEFLLKKNKIALVKARAQLEGPGRIVASGEGGEEAWEAGAVILATGSEPVVIPGLESDGDRVLDSDGVLEMAGVPSSLAIIGGGAIGCEWASLFASLGARVELVEILDRLLPGADADTAKEVERGFKKRGMKLHLKSKVESLDRGTGEVCIRLSSGTEIRVERVMVSTGRRPAYGETLTAGCGVETDGGAVPVDGRTATNVKGVHAVGDVTGRVLLAHFATHQGLVAAENLTGGNRRTDELAVPMCVFSEPEAAWVGHSEAGAAEAGIEVQVGTFPFRALGRAHASEEIWGFVKVLAEKGTGRVVGFHAVGPHATDLVAEGTLAVKYGLTASQLEEAIHAHPTFSEAVMEASGDVLGMAIHK